MTHSATHHVQREDARKIGTGASFRDYVPTLEDTVWVCSWEQFKDVGGVMNFNEDQTEIVLTLPVGHKFGIGFQRPRDPA